MKELSEEQIEKIALEHEAFGFGKVDHHGLTTHGFDPAGLLGCIRTALNEFCKINGLGEAQSVSYDKTVEPVARFFLPPARHEGVVEHTAGIYHLRVTGLTIRQIKEIFEDKFLGSMMWSNGAAYPTDVVEVRFINPQPADAVRVPEGSALVPVEPTKEMVKAASASYLECHGYGADWIVKGYRAMIAAAPKPWQKEAE